MLPLLGATPSLPPSPHSKIADISGNYERIEGDEYDKKKCLNMLPPPGATPPLF